MTPHTIDAHHLPSRTTERPGRPEKIDTRRLGPMAREMRLLAARQGAYVAPTANEYLAY
jgi:hypothetical protein